jgi:hypothetical protein
MEENVYDGEPVYPTFSEATHVRKGLAVVSKSDYNGGWDCGATLQPGFILLQVTPEQQVQAIGEVFDGDASMEEFAPMVGLLLQDLIPDRMSDVRHDADATVKQRSGTRKETAQQVAAEHGFQLNAASNVWTPRVSAVTWLLSDRLPSGEPRFLIDPEACPVLYRGFQGAYKFEESTKGDSAGPGRISLMPLKNGFSHVQDALQYAAMKVRASMRTSNATPRRKARTWA